MITDMSLMIMTGSSITVILISIIIIIIISSSSIALVPEEDGVRHSRRDARGDLIGTGLMVGSRK